MSEEERYIKVVLALRDGLAEVVERLNDILKELAPETAIPQLDLGDLEELPWTSYKTKERCKEGEAGWIFSNTQGAEELVKAIKATENGKLELGEYLFQLSGKEKQFISRRPLKRSSNPHNRMDKNLRNIKSAAERMGVNK